MENKGTGEYHKVSFNKEVPKPKSDARETLPIICIALFLVFIFYVSIAMIFG